MSNTGILLAISATIKKSPRGFAASSLLLWMGIDPMYLFSLTVIMLLDIISGTIKGIVTEKYKNSSDILNGLLKRFGLLLIIVAVGASSTMFDGLTKTMLVWITSAGMAAFALSQVHSVIGNVYVMRFKKDVKDQEATAKLVAFMQMLITKTLEALKDGMLYVINNYLKNENKKGKQ